MKKKRVILIIGIVVLSIALLIGILIGGFYLFVLSGAIFSFGPNPPEPQITYGEFPISITYEIDGEIKKVEDIVVCEFDGFENLGSAGKYRTWKSSLKSGNDSLTLLHIEEENLIVKIGVSRGLPEYYMGDFQHGQSREDYERVMADDRYLGFLQWENGVPTGQPIKKEEAWEKYKFKIIDIQYSPPITNSFE